MTNVHGMVNKFQIRFYGQKISEQLRTMWVPYGLVHVPTHRAVVCQTAVALPVVDSQIFP